MKKRFHAVSIAALIVFLIHSCHSVPVKHTALRVGAASLAITPFGQNSDWDGPITASGVWGEKFTDSNHNGRWDAGEPFTDDDGSSVLEAHSGGKYDGIYLAGFGNNRIATGKHDDLWARALVLDIGSTRFAIVSVDLIGYYSHSSYYGADEVRKLLNPALGVQEVLISSTHNHEGPDTIGLWGANPVSDGKFPRYLRFVDRQIARAIAQAAESLTPVRIKLGATNPQLSPTLTGMQTRTGGRPPAFFDEQLRAMQFVGNDGLREVTVATLVNWNTHPESMESQNTTLTSDFPGALRESIEKRYGGTAIYVSGDLGAVEIIGDNDRATAQRTTFDGKTFTVSRDKAATFTFDRTEAIGRDVAKAAIDAIERGEWSHTNRLELRKAELRVPLENAGYRFLFDRGVLALMKGMEDRTHPYLTTMVYALQVGDAQVITAPGELFPEIFYGVEKYRRTDCPPADTHEPPEPAVRDSMSGKYRFVFGLCPDELGYIVPRYDFHAPSFNAEHGLREAKDACHAQGVPAHYHETNSASSQLAPLWACTAARLLGQNVQSTLACAKNEQPAGK